MMAPFLIIAALSMTPISPLFPSPARPLERIIPLSEPSDYPLSQSSTKNSNNKSNNIGFQRQVQHHVVAIEMSWMMVTDDMRLK